MAVTSGGAASAALWRVPPAVGTQSHVSGYASGFRQVATAKEGSVGLLLALDGFRIAPDMTDVVLSNPDLVRRVLSGDREAREGRFLSWGDVFGE